MIQAAFGLRGARSVMRTNVSSPIQVLQIMLTTAYRYAPASVIAPFDYTAMIFALGIGYFAFAELPSAQMILGAGIVIAAGVFVILREARLGLRRGQARRAKPPPAL